MAESEEELAIASSPKSSSHAGLLVILGALSVLGLAGVGYMFGYRRAQEYHERELEGLLKQESLQAMNLQLLHSEMARRAQAKGDLTMKLATAEALDWGKLNNAVRQAMPYSSMMIRSAIAAQRKALLDSVEDAKALQSMKDDVAAARKAVKEFRDGLVQEDQRNRRHADACLEALLNLEDLLDVSLRYHQAYQEVIATGCGQKAKALSAKAEPELALDQMRLAALLFTLAADIDSSYNADLERLTKLLEPPQQKKRGG